MFDYIILLVGQLEWNIPFLTGLIIVGALYVHFVKRSGSIKWYHKKPYLFFLGMILLYVTAFSPLVKFTHLSFSLHMIRMSMLFFIVPPLILSGIPDAFIKKEWRKRNKWFSPMTALISFSVLFLVYHLPAVLNIITRYPFLYNGYSTLLFILSVGMWWPLAGPVPDPASTFCMENREKMKRYAMVSGLIIMPACLLFIVNSLTVGMNNPFLAQINSTLCLPASSGSFNLLPYPFNSRWDQLMAGTLMLGIHKLGIMMTFRLNTDKVRDLDKPANQVSTIQKNFDELCR